VNIELVILKTAQHVKELLDREGTGHDWWHIERVRKNALTIARAEKADLVVVELGALLHDIADHKFYLGNHSVGPGKARELLESLSVDATVIKRVVEIVERTSFSKEKKEGSLEKFLELKVVQDADRLDAIGAIGIARAFAYGGHISRPIYDPRGGCKSTLMHFHDKLLNLKDQMNTEVGRKLAVPRHAFMEKFVTQFLDELGWEIPEL
jgi:uncharacterized protein